MEYGNYMMIVKVDGNGVLDHKYSDIKSAYEQGVLVVLKTGDPDYHTMAYLMTLDEAEEDAFTVVFFSVPTTFRYKAETIESFPVSRE